MHTPDIEAVVIVGSGCAGLTAAIYTGRARLEPLIIEGEQPGGQLTTTTEVENFPGFPDGVDGFALMENLRAQATRFGARFKQTWVTEVDFSSSPKRIVCDGEVILAQTVIIATGASPKLTGVPGEKELFGGGGVSVCATCDGAFYRGKEVAVLGGGDSAVEEALFLTRFCRKVYLVHRRNELRASKIMADRAIAHAQIELVWETIPLEIEGNVEGGVTGLRMRHLPTGDERRLTVDGVFVAIGHRPNTAPFDSALPTDPNGYFLTITDSQVRTVVPGVFVAGDCADHVYRQAITAAGMGCQAALEAQRWLSEQLI